MWTFKQSSGEYLDPGLSVKIVGYSGGDCGRSPEGVNNPECESQRRVGPIPKGRYTISSPIDHPRLGAYVLFLTPDKDNEMFGRSGFAIHGDNKELNQSASEGCIIIPRLVREEVWLSGDHRLQVIE